MDGLLHGLDQALGLHTQAQNLTLTQTCLRSILTYLVGLVILRLARSRFLARESPFDVILAFILGSVLSRAINGAGPFLMSLAAAALLVGIHWVFSWLTCHSRRFERLTDGLPDVILRDGQLIPERLRHHRLSRGNVEEALRLGAKLRDPSQVAEARVECNGEISFLPRPAPARVVEVRVEAGVQVVRLEIS